MMPHDIESRLNTNIWQMNIWLMSNIFLCHVQYLFILCFVFIIQNEHSGILANNMGTPLLNLDCSRYSLFIVYMLCLKQV